jgi:hypothetical protein
MSQRRRTETATPMRIAAVPQRITVQRRLVQSRVDAEIVAMLQEAHVDIPELIRRACARAATRVRQATTAR